VTQHGALGPARGARGVEQRREIVRGPRNGREVRRLAGREIVQRSFAVGVHGQQARAVVLGDRRQCVRSFRIAEQQARRRVPGEVADLVGRVGGIERYQHDAGLNAGDVDRERVRRFRDLHGEPVAGPEPCCRQGIRVSRRAVEERTIAQTRPVAEDQRRRFALAPLGEQRVVERVGHRAAAAVFMYILNFFNSLPEINIG